MIKTVKGWLAAHMRIVHIAIASLFALVILLTVLFKEYFWLYISIGALIVYIFYPGSVLHRFTCENRNALKIAIAVLVAGVTITLCVLPMDNLSLWNGEDPGHRNQYELMADAILDGRIDFDYGDEDNLANLKNPYDPDERNQAGVYYHWDHAYYNGHYYMYFGVVPVFLVFIPYKLLTGTSLTTFHATQIFVAFIIAGIFMLFYLLAKLFFKKMPFGVYLALSVAFSVMSVWFSIAEPALYCTAITAAIALMVWSLYFFIRAVWGETKENKQIVLAAIGALLGALAFGCRPPIALANILVIPMLVVFIKQHKFSFKLLGKLALAALPYVFVGVALMCYNYARFEDPFEFGQAYQLTVSDQHLYSITLDAKTILRIVNDSTRYFFDVGWLSESFPYVNSTSVFFNFPILFICFAILSHKIRKEMKDSKILSFVIGLLITSFIITAMDIVWSPYLLERYRMDIYFIMGIACFMIIGFWYNSCSEKGRRMFSTVMIAFALITTASSYLIYVRTVGLYYPEELVKIGEALGLV